MLFTVTSQYVVNGSRLTSPCGTHKLHKTRTHKQIESTRVTYIINSSINVKNSTVSTVAESQCLCLNRTNYYYAFNYNYTILYCLIFYSLVSASTFELFIPLLKEQVISNRCRKRLQRIRRALELQILANHDNGLWSL